MTPTRSGIWGITLQLGELVHAPVVSTIVPLVFAPRVAARVRWIPALAGLIAGLMLFGALQTPAVAFRLAHSEMIGPFVATIAQLVGAALAAVTGIGATVIRYRR